VSHFLAWSTQTTPDYTEELCSFLACYRAPAGDDTLRDLNSELEPGTDVETDTEAHTHDHQSHPLDLTNIDNHALSEKSSTEEDEYEDDKSDSGASIPNKIHEDSGLLRDDCSTPVFH
jgi:hypothetical protein